MICFGLAFARPRSGLRVRVAQPKAPGDPQSLRGQGVLSEAQVEAALREIRLALLEADVHFKVTKQIVDRVRARATGQDVLKSLSPDQAVLRIVRDEMVEVLGGAEAMPLESAKHPPASS